MKNKRFWTVMLVLTLTFGMTVVGCEDEDETDDPTNNNDVRITIGNWEWDTYSDSIGGGTSTITMTQGTGTDSNKITLSGNLTNKIQWGGYVGSHVYPIGTELEKLKTATSISFKVKGDGKTYRFIFATSDITDNSYFHTTFITTNNTETTVTININSLQNADFGQGKTKTHLEKSYAKWVEFSYQNSTEGPFNITISDLTLND